MVGEVCPGCGWTDGHDVENCPLVLAGKVKPMAGLPPDVVDRLKAMKPTEGSQE